MLNAAFRHDRKNDLLSVDTSTAEHDLCYLLRRICVLVCCTCLIGFGHIDA